MDLKSDNDWFDDNFNVNQSNSLVRSSQIPSTYSSVDEGFVTSIKNQRRLYKSLLKYGVINHKFKICQYYLVIKTYYKGYIPTNQTIKT